VAGTDLTRSLYSGMYGFLIIEPTSDPGRYDQEGLLAAHHWEPRWVSMQDTPIWRIASVALFPCEISTSTCQSFATISSGLYRFLGIAVLLDAE
jgi:hypothetical protein